MPLSEEELRLLEQMERALVAEDPKLASTMRGTTLPATARRRALMAAGVFVVGVVVLMTGAVMQITAVGIIGFVVMLASAYVALARRNQNQAPEHGTPRRARTRRSASSRAAGRTSAAPGAVSPSPTTRSWNGSRSAGAAAATRTATDLPGRRCPPATTRRSPRGRLSSCPAAVSRRPGPCVRPAAVLRPPGRPGP